MTFKAKPCLSSPHLEGRHIIGVKSAKLTVAEAFRVLAGVPRHGIFDNTLTRLRVDMRTAVDRSGLDKGWQVRARLTAMASHYLSRSRRA